MKIQEMVGLSKEIRSLEVNIEKVADRMGQLANQLQKIEAVVDDLYIKAQLSHSLLIVRKVDSRNLKEMEKLMD